MIKLKHIERFHPLAKGQFSGVAATPASQEVFAAPAPRGGMKAGRTPAFTLGADTGSEGAADTSCGAAPQLQPAFAST